jgi:type 1 glutamine amidotransferase
MNIKSNFKIVVSIFLLFTSSIVYAKQFNVLLFTKTDGWHHKSINKAVDAMQAMSENHFFNFEWHEDASHINSDNLKKFDVVMFMLTTGDILNSKQQSALQEFIHSGKGFVGVHSASDTEYEWPWYTQLVGHSFHIHPEIQTARLKVLDRSFPGLEYMPDEGLWTEEWYEFSEAKVKGLNYLLSVDENTYKPAADWGDKKGNGMGKFHPIAWYHQFDGGRSFYTGLGHMPATYKNKAFVEHIYGGLYWAATGKGISQR